MVSRYFHKNNSTNNPSYQFAKLKILKPTSMKAHILFVIKSSHAPLENIFSQKQFSLGQNLSHHVKNNNTYLGQQKIFWYKNHVLILLQNHFPDLSSKKENSSMRRIFYRQVKIIDDNFSGDKKIYFSHQITFKNHQ